MVYVVCEYWRVAFGADDWVKLGCEGRNDKGRISGGFLT